MVSKDVGGPAGEFFQSLERSIAEDTFVKLTLGKRVGGEDDLKNLYVRPLETRKGGRLSFLYRHKTRDVTKNHEPREAVELLRDLLGPRFRSGHLFTTAGDLQIEFNRRGEPRLLRREPTFDAPPAAEHNRRKRRFVETEGNVYLRELGVTDACGEVREKMGDKYRQINKFVETVADLYKSSDLAGRRSVSVLDVGSGKGYLTFAVYDYFANTVGVKAYVTGVEARGELVDLCNRVARTAGFEGLRFETGLIESYEVGHTDVLIALHACDTATDDAIFKGVTSGASVIITAPCCHKQVRRDASPPGELSGMLRHGILLERQCEMVTDGLRALLLEYHGYDVKVFEFVSTEHTHKNVMVAGVRRKVPADVEKLRRQIEDLKRTYGVREHHLERLFDSGVRAAADT